MLLHAVFSSFAYGETLIDDDVDGVVITLNCQTERLHVTTLQFQDDSLEAQGFGLDFKLEEQIFSFLSNDCSSGACKEQVTPIGTIETPLDELCPQKMAKLVTTPVKLSTDTRLHVGVKGFPCEKHRFTMIGEDSIRYSMAKELKLFLPDGRTLKTARESKQGFGNLGTCIEYYNRAIGKVDESCEGIGFIGFVKASEIDSKIRIECQPSAKNPRNKDVPLCACRAPIQDKPGKCRVYQCTVDGVSSGPVVDESKPQARIIEVQ